MSTATAEVSEEVKVPKKRKPFLSKKDRKVLTDPLDEANPITVQVLGLCSALAVTTQVKPAFVMTLCVIFVCGFANLTISLLRNTIPSSIRMIVQLVVIASLVTVVSEVLKAYQYALSKELSVYIGLIITNCLIMGRLEAFAMSNKPWQSFLDGLGNGVGYGVILIFVAVARELFGSGSLFKVQLIPQFVYDLGYVNNGLMLTPAAAMFLIGIFIWWQRARKPQLIDIS